MDEEHAVNDNTGSLTIKQVLSWVERVTRRSLGDVRIHDSEQAGQLVRRLGARAFTAGRDVYVRPELLRPFTRESGALLAHELYHVAEQSGEVATSQAGLPLLRPMPSHARGHSGHSVSGHRPSAPVSRASTPGVGLATQRQATQNVTVQRATSGGLSGSEAAAEAVQAVAQQAQQREKESKQAPPDPELVADLVYREMARQLILDRERGAY